LATELGWERKGEKSGKKMKGGRRAAPAKSVAPSATVFDPRKWSGGGNPIKFDIRATLFVHK
jgi:hypothetical protein